MATGIIFYSLRDFDFRFFDFLFIFRVKSLFLNKFSRSTEENPLSIRETTKKSYFVNGPATKKWGGGGY